MSTHDRSRRRFAGHRGNPPPPPSQAPQAPTQRVMPRGGNGVHPRRPRVEQALERGTIPVEPAQPPASRLLRTDASVAAVQEGFSDVSARLEGIEDGLRGLAHALRVMVGLAEADDELEQLRQQNLDLQEQRDAAHHQLNQIRTSVGVSAFADVPRPTIQSAPAPAVEPTPTPPVDED